METFAQNPPTEKDLSEDLIRRLDILVAEGRCTWHPEVRMACLAHASRIGNGQARVADISGVTVPEEWAHTHPFARKDGASD